MGTKTIAPLYSEKPAGLQLDYTVGEVAATLDRLGVPWRTWKDHPTARPIEHLIKYLNEDQVTFRGPDHRIIDVNAAVILVFYDNGSTFELYEEYQLKPGSAEKLVRSHDFDGIAETMRKGEDVERAAKRGLREELKFWDPRKYTLHPLVELKELTPMKSEKFPGLLAVYRRHISHCYISKALYKPEGYLECEENGREIKFSWRECNKKSRS